MKWRSLEESTAEVGTRSLADVLLERKQLIEKYVPADVRAVHQRVVNELRNSGISTRALPVGSQAPEFVIPDHNGNPVRSADLLLCSRLVICFFRGRWCPFCVGQLEAMNSALPQIQQLGATLVGISPQTRHQSYLMADQHRLQFPLLCDDGNAVAKKFGLVYQVPDYQQEIYRSAFVNLPFANGDASWELPIPATYIVDRDSTILFAQVDPDYSARPEPGDIVKFLSQLPE
jgi:peroxiredoxin